jgi:hypothetical protein
MQETSFRVAVATRWHALRTAVLTESWLGKQIEMLDDTLTESGALIRNTWCVSA